jgi:hypothetical protein
MMSLTHSLGREQTLMRLRQSLLTNSEDIPAAMTRKG